MPEDNSLETSLANLTPTQRKRLVELAKHPHNPVGWKSSTTASYYTEDWANWIKLTLDEMLEKPTATRKFMCKDFKVSPATLRARIEQAWQWLIDNVDTEEKPIYNSMRRAIEIQRDDDVKAIRLIWKVAKADMKMVKASEIVPDPETRYEWRREFLEWVENAKDLSMFVKTEQDLTEEDIDWIKTQIEQLPEFHILTLKPSIIKVAKDVELGNLK